MIPAVDVCTDRAADKWVSGRGQRYKVRSKVRRRECVITPHPVLCCGTQRAERGRRGHGRGPGVRCVPQVCGVAGRPEGRAWPVAPCRVPVGRKWRGVGHRAARAGQPWILLNADRADYTATRGWVSLLLVFVCNISGVCDVSGFRRFKPSRRRSRQASRQRSRSRRASCQMPPMQPPAT